MNQFTNHESQTMMIARRRWSDNQTSKGPFTYSRDTLGRPFGIVLDSGEGEYPGCHLRLRGFGHTLIIELPQVIKPWRRWVDTSHYSWSTNPRGGYWDEYSNEYGFILSDGFLQVYLGPQTDDSLTTKSWNKFLPWTQWRFVRETWYDEAGEHAHTIRQSAKRGAMISERVEFEMKGNLPKVAFLFSDYDGEVITATTCISESEYRLGEQWFKWLSLFSRPRIHRSLDLKFSKEVGREKGSWKGGTTGHSIELMPGELHESAFIRYCQQHKLTFIGTLST